MPPNSSATTVLPPDDQLIKEPTEAQLRNVEVHSDAAWNFLDDQKPREALVEFSAAQHLALTFLMPVGGMSPGLGGALPASDREVEPKLRAAPTDSNAPRLSPAKAKPRLLRLLYWRVPLGLGRTNVTLNRNSEAIRCFERIARAPFEPEVEWVELWLELGRVVIAHANDLYRSERRTEAREWFALIMTDSPADAMMYRGHLSSMRGRIRKLEAQQDHLMGLSERDDDLDPKLPELAEILFTARAGILQIDKHFNVLGLPDSYWPSVSWRRLYPVARGFAETAAQAARQVLDFEHKVSANKLASHELAQTVALNGKAYQLERQREREVQAEHALAQAGLEEARTRQANAAASHADYADVGWQRVQLDEAIAWASAVGHNEPDVSFGGLDHLGISDGYQPRSKLIKRLTARRASRSYQAELDALGRQVTALADAEDVAKKRIAVTEVMEQTAAMRSQMAKWKWIASQQTLNLVQQRRLESAELQRFAQVARETSRIYLDRAVRVAFAMERAYEFELGVEIDKIRFDYVLEGLTAADMLLRDVDYFSFHDAIEGARRAQPLIFSISLRSRFPAAFARFQQTGELNFATELDDFHEHFPGLCHAMIRRVELQIFGVSGPNGAAGRLSTSGISRVRKRSGEIVSKSGPPETMLLSPHPAPGASEDLSGTLQAFEHMGLATDWNLRVSPGANPFEVAHVEDVTMLFRFSAEYDPSLEAKDLAARPSEGTHQLSLSVRHDFAPEAWEQLGRSAPVSLELARGNFPAWHTAPRVRGLTFVAIGRDGAARPLIIRFGLQTLERFEADDHGMILVQDPNAPVWTDSLIDKWKLQILGSDNPTLQDGSGGVQLESLRDLIWVIEYSTTYAR